MKRLIFLVLLFVCFVFEGFCQFSSVSVDDRVAYSVARSQKRVERRYGLMQEQLETPHQLRIGFGSRYMEGMPVFGVSADYGYRVEDFLDVAVSVAFGSGSNGLFYGNYFNDCTYLGVSVYGRYSWVNRRWFSVYSSLGLGTTYMWYNSLYEGTNGNVSNVSFNGWYGNSINIEIIPIGFRVGRRYYGCFEPFGYSVRGVYSMFSFGIMF